MTSKINTMKSKKKIFVRSPQPNKFRISSYIGNQKKIRKQNKK